MAKKIKIQVIRKAPVDTKQLAGAIVEIAIHVATKKSEEATKTHQEGK